MHRDIRYSLLVGAAEFIPVPVADTWVQNRLRRRMVRGEAEAVGVQLSDEQVAELADEPTWDVRRLLTWPVRKILGKVLLPFQLARVASDTVDLASRVRQLSAAS